MVCNVFSVGPIFNTLLSVFFESTLNHETNPNSFYAFDFESKLIKGMGHTASVNAGYISYYVWLSKFYLNLRMWVFHLLNQNEAEFLVASR